MPRTFKALSWRSLGLFAIALTLALGAWGCFDKDNSPTAPDQEQFEAPLLSAKNPAVQSVMSVVARHTPSLMSQPNVIGTATSVTDDGRPAILVLVTTREAGHQVPRVVDGVPVRIMLTDPIMAYKGPPGNNGDSHTAKQDPPIKLGVSGGPANDLANGFCCGGTLGSLVQIGGTKYILSNSHVFAGDVVNGGNGTKSALGDDISHPGLIDTGCNPDQDFVADLSSLSTLFPPASTPNVDVAIAAVRAGMVSAEILEIGFISSSTVGASIRQNVKKSGRTTGLTRSRVEGLDATVNVGYSDECAGGSFTKTFTGQIIIRNKGSKFLDSGDSGSLMVEDESSSPRAIGLLFAGSSQTAVANPIGDVLTHLGGGATMVDSD